MDLGAGRHRLPLGASDPQLPSTSTNGVEAEKNPKVAGHGDGIEGNLDVGTPKDKRRPGAQPRFSEARTTGELNQAWIFEETVRGASVDHKTLGPRIPPRAETPRVGPHGPAEEAYEEKTPSEIISNDVGWPDGYVK